MVSNEGDTIELVVHSPKAVAQQHKQRAGISFGQLSDARCDMVGRRKSSGGLWARVFRSKWGSWLSSDHEALVMIPSNSRHTSISSIFSEVVSVENISFSSGSSMRLAETDDECEGSISSIDFDTPVVNAS